MNCFVNGNFPSFTIFDFFLRCLLSALSPRAVAAAAGWPYVSLDLLRPAQSRWGAAGRVPLRGRRGEGGRSPRGLAELGATWLSWQQKRWPGSRRLSPSFPRGSPRRAAGWPMSVRRCLVGLTFCTCYLASYLTNKVRGAGAGRRWAHLGRGTDAASSCESDFSWWWWRGSWLCMESLFRNRIRWTILAPFPALESIPYISWDTDFLDWQIPRNLILGCAHYF